MKRNEKERFTVHCKAKQKGCPWRLYASVMEDKESMMIKRYEGLHMCIRKVDPRMADTTWLSGKFVEQLKEHPNMSAKKLEEWVGKKLKVTIPYMKVWRARERAISILGGNPEEAYKLAPKYAEMVLRTNPGSISELMKIPRIDRAPEFHRYFCGLEGLKRGFLGGCSRFLFFDGCFLKGKYVGALLSAVGTDANCGLYPLAWAIVESECKESWGFFLHCIENFVGPWDSDTHWHLMADRQKGLVPVIEEKASTVINRKCAKHIYDNLKLQWSGVLLKMGSVVLFIWLD